jgi:hypothetical protein
MKISVDNVGNLSPVIALLCVLSLGATKTEAGQAPPMTQLSATQNVVVNDQKMDGYDVTGIPLKGKVRMDLTVNDVDPNADFVPESGKATSTGGEVAWKPVENGANRFKADSATFQRDHTKHIVLTDGKWQLGGGGGGAQPIWEVAVVQIRMIVDGEKFPLNGKLLATATHALTAEKVFPPGKEPGGIPTWTFSGDGKFDPETGLETKFTAGKTLTPAADLNKQEIRVEMPTGGSASVDDEPLNITAPKKFSASKTGTISDIAPKKTYDSRSTSDRDSLVTIVNAKVTYVFYDQFGTEISRSDDGDKKVQRKEDVNWQGHPDELVQWANGEQHGYNREWGDLERTPRLPDDLFIPLPLSKLYNPLTKKFTTGTVLKLEGDSAHVWHATVGGNSDLDTKFTNNTATVEVEEVASGRDWNIIKLKGKYTVTITAP